MVRKGFPQEQEGVASVLEESSEEVGGRRVDSRRRSKIGRGGVRGEVGVGGGDVAFR